MPKDVAIARATSPLSRRRAAFWLSLALLLTLAVFAQLGHTVPTSAAGSDAGYALIAAADRSGHDCPSHGGVIPGSHCCSVSGCVMAIASTSATTSPRGAEMAEVVVRSAAAPGRLPSPLFHPPKLIVQA